MPQMARIVWNNQCVLKIGTQVAEIFRSLYPIAPFPTKEARFALQGDWVCKRFLGKLVDSVPGSSTRAFLLCKRTLQFQ